KYPRTVLELIMDALPWTLALLLVTTILSFAIGNLLGAVAAWPRAPGWLRTFATPFILLQGIPPVLMGFLLLFFVAFRLSLAMLPQVTGLALALTGVVTSGVVVEQIFGLPGIGQALSVAIANNDFLVIYGIVLFITIAVATLMVLVELMYPLLDPRIRHT